MLQHVMKIRPLKIKDKIEKMESPSNSLRRLRILKHVLVLKIYVRGWLYIKGR